MTLLERDLENQEIGRKEMKRVMTRKLNAEKKKNEAEEQSLMERMEKKNEAEKQSLMERMEKKNEAEKQTLIERMLRRGKMTLEEIAEDVGVSLFAVQEMAKHM